MDRKIISSVAVIISGLIDWWWRRWNGWYGDVSLWDLSTTRRVSVVYTRMFIGNFVLYEKKCTHNLCKQNTKILVAMSDE